MTLRAAEPVAAKPGLAHVGRIWFRRDSGSGRCRGTPYLPVFDADRTPPAVARFVHQARDRPVLLSDLGG
jgi:hypothetical protein